MMQINDLTMKGVQVINPKGSEMGGAAPVAGQGSFADALKKGVESVNKDLIQADKVSTEFMTGGKHDIHEVMIALEKADLSFRYMAQVRNKVLDAYAEVMRMQV